MTNDVKPLNQPGCGPVYAAFLTAKGKLLHDVFICRSEASKATRLLVDVDVRGKESLMDWLKRCA